MEGVGTFEHGRRAEMARVFMRQLFAWMTAGLAVSGVIAALVLSSTALYQMAASLFFPLVIGELVLVFFLSARLKKMSVSAALTMFLAYAALNGLTIGVVVAMYTGASVARVFFITAGTFGAMTAIGFTTKRDLTEMGTFFLMGLIALIIASVVNIFLMSSALDWALSIVGVLLFCGLTAYDVQRFQALGYMGFTSEKAAGQMAVRGALNLYLDFINLFLYLLRLFGDRR
ncbi:MAG TPA: hypothetical protein DCQ06_01425 [Myxococcales bacterium]|nr:hypothetical protein [Myxococcales bacterium]